MERLAALISEHQPEFRDLVTDELGHTKITGEVYHSVAPTLHWNYYAKVGREHTFAEVRESDMSPLAGNAGGLIMKYETKSLLVREPVGVVAALCAFNFPLAGIAQKTAPAIVAGCTVVVKAPDPDPLSLFAMADLVTEAGFPPGVINIIAATTSASQRLVAHPDVDMVTFTGSTEVGKKIAEVCGAQVKRCVLELGGKSAAIILEDADLDTALPMVVGTSVGTSQGENCTCMSRILAPRSRYDEIAGALTAAFESLKVGDPNDDDTVLGPMVTEAHRERVLKHIEGAIDEGATVATGGGVPEHLDKGWYVEATLLTNVTNDMKIAQEEVFGPVIALIPFDDEEDAFRIANDSRFGLSGSVFTGDPVRGFEVARRVRTGTFRVNTMSADFNSSFGGYKESGIGREHGPYAIDEYLLDKTISIEPSGEFPDEVVEGIEVAPATV
jgi:betaine-aldehyde dehydrogenase